MPKRLTRGGHSVESDAMAAVAAGASRVLGRRPGVLRPGRCGLVSVMAALAPLAPLAPLALLAGAAVLAGAPASASARAAGQHVPASPRVLPPVGDADRVAGALEDVAEERPPGPAEALRAHRQVRAWLDGWAPPARPAPDELPPAAGASVQIRLAGRWLGRGTAWTASGTVAGAGRLGAAEGPVWRATLDAFAEADRRLPVPRDALRSEAVIAAGRDALLSIELAGAATPIEPRTFAELDERLSPGLDGVLARQGGRVEVIFPGTMLASGLSPGEAARSLVSRLTGQPALALAEPQTLRQQQGISLAWFAVTHAAQCGPREPAIILTRGARAVHPGDITAAELTRSAQALALHLAARRWNEDDPDAPAGGLRGTLRPWAVDDRPALAGVSEQALAALALRRFARQAWADGAVAGAARDGARAILRDLADVALEEPRPWDDVPGSALVVLALLEPDGALDAAPDAPPGAPPGATAPPWEVDLLARCAETVRGAFAVRTGFNPALTPPARGAVAAALVALARPRAGAAGVERSVGAAALRTVLRDTPPELMAGLMPLAGWADLELAQPGALDGAGGARGGEAPGLASAPAWRQARVALWALQRRGEDARIHELDLVGGLALERAEARSATPDVEAPWRRPPRPTWQSARPLAFLASMLADERLTPAGEAPGELARLLAGARFIRQLQHDEFTGWMESSPRLARGAVRAGPGDMSLPPDASSAALLALVELRAALDAPRR